MSEKKLNITNKFLKLAEDTAIDPQLKTEVFNTLSSIESVSSVLDLFTNKFLQTNIDVVSNIVSGNNKEEQPGDPEKKI